MKLSVKQCISKLREEYPDLNPYAYIEFQNSYVFNLLSPDQDPEYAIAEFHSIDPNTGDVSGNIPTLLLLKNEEFRNKWKNANLVDESLEHHGIPGQQWGTQNGPPYPLDKQTHNKVVNSKKDDSTGKLSSNTVETIVYSSAIAAYIGLRILDTKIYKKRSQLRRDNDNVAISKDLLSDIADVGKHFSDKNPPKKIVGSHTPEQDMAAVNPKFYNAAIVGTRNNCTLCAFTYDLRRRGYDVTANASNEKGNFPIELSKELYESPKRERAGSSSFTGVFDNIAKKYPDGARGEFSAYGYFGGGHSMVFETNKGKTVVRCPQTNTILDAKKLQEWGFNPKTVQITRTDNLKVKMESVHKICSELKPGWKKVVSKESKQYTPKVSKEKVQAAAGRKIMTESEKRKSLEKQWRREHRGEKLDPDEARIFMNKWIDGHMWSYPESVGNRMKCAFDAWDYANPSLSHYGITGQKWGVRNYQNEDGSLTPAGKLRYLVTSTYTKHKEEREAKKKLKIASMPESLTWKAKDAKTLSDAELNRRNNRLIKEDQYRRLTESKPSKIKRNLKNSLKDPAKKIFVGTAVSLAVPFVKDNYKKLFSAIGKTGVSQKAGQVITSAGKTLVKNLDKIKVKG